MGTSFTAAGLTDSTIEREEREIEILRAEDWERVRERILVIEESSFPPDLRYSAEDFQHDLSREGSRFLILKEREVIQGFLHALPLEELDYLSFDEEWGRGDTLYVVNIALMPDLRGRGGGSRLLRHLLETTPFVRYAAHAVSPSSLRLFSGAGFRRDRVFPRWMGEHDGVYMICDKTL
mgnify:FL=1